MSYVFQVSLHSRDALNVLLELEAAAGPVSARAIAASLDMPESQIATVLLKLREAGIVVTKRGVGGGQSLCMSPDEISALLVVEAVDGHSWGEDEGPLAEALRAAREVLAATTIADIATRRLNEGLAMRMFI